MKFCPWDGSLLVLDNESRHGGFRFRCAICYYVSKLEPDQVTTLRTTYKAKEVDDILGGEEAWKNVPETEALCTTCGSKRAYFMQIQTRSADEPMTVFYKCTKCKKQWRE